MQNLTIAHRERPALRRLSLRAEAGFTLIEVLVASLVLVTGMLALLGMLIVANHATSANRVRQTATSLAREVAEDARTLGYSQLLASSIASSLQPLVPGSTLSGTTLAVTRAGYSYSVSFTECSLDDPADGYGSHASAPTSGGSWCPDVAASGTADSNPDDYKRVSVIVTPTTTQTPPRVQQTILIYARPVNGPAVSCLSTNATCPGTSQTITSGTSQGFNVTTTQAVAAVQWLVNGALPPSAQIPTGSADPYATTGTSSSFTWAFPVADGTYTVAALGFDGNGNSGTRSSLQIVLNRHQVIAPTSITAGWNALLSTSGGVDIQWVPSVDQDVLYYNVYHKYGSSGTASLACSHVTGTTCSDLTATAPLPGIPTCPATPLSYTTANSYWVVGVDTNPANGSPRESTAQSPLSDANLCNHPPNAPTGLTGSISNGQLNLSWTAPSPADPDTAQPDSIQQWRIYRWPSTQAMADPGSRYDLVGAINSSGQSVTSYTDIAPDPGGTSQSYCVSAVDKHMGESACSNVVTG